LPPAERATWKEKIMGLKGVVLPAALIAIVLGSILRGVATPTEAAAFGAGGAMLIGLVKKRLTVDIICESCYETLSVSSMVGWTMVCASSFSSVFSGLGGNTMITNIAMNMPGGANVVFFVSALFIFVLGMFLEPNAIIFLAIPILAPILTRLGFDALWIGLVFNMLLQCGYISPPFGFSLFYLRGCTPDDITLIDIYKSSVPFLVIQVVSIAMIFMFPQIVLWLPKYMMG
jgi:tripartite ATP-independent transporter DctM subunit